jgi:signal peptidase I
MSHALRTDDTRRRSVPLWAETILLLVLALIVSAIVKTFFVQMFFVPSGSMRPLFVNDDRILVEKVSYWGGNDPQRGDVVVFADPGHWLGFVQEPTGVRKLLATIGLYPTGGHLVKRVIGVEGDHIECCDEQGRVSVNGVPLNESSYTLQDVPGANRDFSITVPEDRLWVMGDNRGNSEDSRFHQDLPGKGTIPEAAVVGRVWAVVWPFGRFDVLERPHTFTRQALEHPAGR